MDPRLELVFSRLKDRCNSIVIAGGAAVDFDSATDIDIWFTDKSQHLAQDFLESLPYYRFDDGKSYDIGTLIGEAYIPDLNKPVQVLQGLNVQALLKGFDLSTCRIAYTSRGQRIEGEGWTPTTERPQMLAAQRKSLSRYIKYCTRFGFEPDLEVLQAMTPTKPKIKVEVKSVKAHKWSEIKNIVAEQITKAAIEDFYKNDPMLEALKDKSSKIEQNLIYPDDEPPF